MYVHEVGSGPPVVLVPGLGCDHTMYEPQYRALADDHRCLAVDLRGTGRSPSLRGIPTSEIITTQAAEIATALDERGIPDAHLVGTSYGGAVVQALLLEHRDRVRSAVIADSFCDTRPRSFSERMLMWGARTQPLMYRMPPNLLAGMIRRSYPRWPEAGRVMADAVTNARRDDLIAQRRAINRIRYEDALRRVRCPTLCLVGDHIPQAVEMMRRVRDAIGGSEFHVIEDSFDPSGLCQPDVFTSLIRDWVSRQEHRT